MLAVTPQNGGLLAREDALHDRAQGDLGLAEAHVAAEQAIHRTVGFHILLDLLNAAELILGLVERERLLELALPDVVRWEGEALQPGALGVQLEQTGGQLLGRRLGAGAGA